MFLVHDGLYCFNFKPQIEFPFQLHEQWHCPELMGHHPGTPTQHLPNLQQNPSSDERNNGGLVEYPLPS